MGRIILALSLLLSSLSPQDVKWKKSWPEALKEAKASNKLAILVFFNKGLRDCKRFEEETLPNAAVVSALQSCVCAMIDPDGTDDDNALWQKHGQVRPPMTYVYDPEGKMLTSISALKAEFYAGALAAAGPAYFKLIVPARESLAKDPNQSEKYVMLGEAYQKLDNKVESAAAYAKAVEILGKKGDKAGTMKLLESQMEAYYSIKWYVPAKAACAKILELDPSDGSKLGAKATWVLGCAASDERKYRETVTIMRPACERYKDSPLLDKMLFTLGAGYMYSGDKENAIAVFDEICKKFPSSDTANIAKIQADKLRK
jgi:tetratricopeptide (TPR) repeat protein